MNNGQQDNQVLSSWKEIAAFFGKGVRTVQRWEHELRLPVRRPRGTDKKIVFASTADLSRWMGQQPPPAQPVALHEALERVQHMRALVQEMQTQTERLQTNTERFLRNYARLSERQHRSHRKPS